MLFDPVLMPLFLTYHPTYPVILQLNLDIYLLAEMFPPSKIVPKIRRHTRFP